MKLAGIYLKCSLVRGIKFGLFSGYIQQLLRYWLDVAKLQKFLSTKGNHMRRFVGRFVKKNVKGHGLQEKVPATSMFY